MSIPHQRRRRAQRIRAVPRATPLPPMFPSPTPPLSSIVISSLRSHLRHRARRFVHDVTRTPSRALGAREPSVDEDLSLRAVVHAHDLSLGVWIHVPTTRTRRRRFIARGRVLPRLLLLAFRRLARVPARGRPVPVPVSGRRARARRETTKRETTTRTTSERAGALARARRRHRARERRLRRRARTARAILSLFHV